MEPSWLTPAATVRMALAAADRVLLPAGFARTGRGRVWRRESAELLHIVELHKRGDGYDVQWSTVCPEAVPLLWAEPVDPTGVVAGMITGRPNDVDAQAPAGYFGLGSRVRPDRAENVSACLAAALEPVAATLASLDTRADLRALLLASGEQRTQRVFMLPVSRALQLFSAAVLAVLDARPEASDLIAQAEAAGLSADDDRLRRLQQLAARTI
jgi:hypothetical protein